jgi:sterol desaturase/sphingolipid hydroxylase (fatty acid hydroxylase superfamily)
MTSIVIFATWVAGSCVSAELLGYWLHRLMHSGAIGFLSRKHMNHHLALYGPLQDQRSKQYRDATNGRLSLGNIGVEWLVPAVAFIASALAVFHFTHVRLLYQFIYFACTFSWSFLMLSYLHDAMHIEGVWLQNSLLLNRWFASARHRHDVHHCLINNRGLMDKNFGIGFFVFDRTFGTLSEGGPAFNQEGYQAAQKRFQSVLGERS